MLGHGALGAHALGESPGPGQTLQPGLFVNTSQFFAPTVTRGAVTLVPPLLNDGDTLFTPTVTRGAVSLLPPLLTDADSLFVPTVLPGGVALAVPLLVDDDELFEPVVTQGDIVLLVPLLVDADGFFAPAVVPGAVSITPPLLADADTLFAPRVVQVLSPPLLADADAFFAPTVTRGAVSLTPPLLANGNIFFAPTVALKTQFLAAPLLVNASVLFPPEVAHATPIDAPTALRRTVAAQHSTMPLLWLITIEHDALPYVVRWVNNPLGIVSRGMTFKGRAFKVDAAGDGDETPSLRLTLSNHDRVIGKALESLEGFPKVTLERILAGYPDEPLFVFDDFTSSESRWDGSAVELTVSQDASWNETYPLVRVTPRLFPGLFLS